ncbi:MAG TPA: ABC transporter ATP-binding protein [Actinomycetota bacterium]|nr:ABC transporter ATP-binding protein [Actinomycetota bacterium]
MALLEVGRLAVSYGAVQAVVDASLTVDAGEVVAVIGANGAGKSTMLSCLSGLVRPRSGSALFAGRDLARLKPPAIVAAGLVQVPEGREVFARMTVRENLDLGGWRRRDRSALARELDEALGRFPILGRRRDELAGNLSGGEQQVLALARGLLAKPRLLLLDEPSLGLAPILVEEVFGLVAGIRSDETSVLLVEQNARQALARADRAYVMESGRTTLSGSGAELLDNAEVRTAYLGL